MLNHISMSFCPKNSGRMSCVCSSQCGGPSSPCPPGGGVTELQSGDESPFALLGCPLSAHFLIWFRHSNTGYTKSRKPLNRKPGTSPVDAGVTLDALLKSVLLAGGHWHWLFMHPSQKQCTGESKGQEIGQRWSHAGHTG